MEAPRRGYRHRANTKWSHEMNRKALVEIKKADQFDLDLHGAPRIDFLDCERLQLPYVSVHLHFDTSLSICTIKSRGILSAADK